jgi:acyl-[acyl carrier protein]--UDP-N-acetylglucosamine O-acyltransferase
MKISIITVCYNRASVIQKAIESVLAQTYKDIEYIVVDGASTDGSMKVIGVNVVGLSRRGVAKESIQALKEAHRFLYREGLNRSQALDRVEHDIEQFEEIKALVRFYRNSQRGVA